MMKKIKTHTLHLTESAIREYRSSDIKTLRDTETALYFRYTKDRQCGTFYVVKRPGGNAPAKWHRLASNKELTASEARKAAKRKLIRLIEDRPSASDDIEMLKTLHNVLNWYQARRKQETGVRPDTTKATVSNINRALRIMPDAPIDKVNKTYIDKHLYLPMMDSYKLSTFEATLKTIKAAFAQAEKLEIIEVSPISNASFTDYSKVKPPPRPTRLDESAIASLIKSLHGAPLKTRMLGAWLLMHGSRVGETSLACMERLKGGRWEKSEGEVKNGQLNVLPLTDHAQEVLRRYRFLMRKRTGYRGRYLFSQKRNRRKPISSTQASNMIRNATRGKVSPHDIRKRARTWWTENNIDYFIGELIVGHKMKDLDTRYIQTQAQAATKIALDKWHDYLVSQGLLTLFDDTYR
jgi:integrase